MSFYLNSQYQPSDVNNILRPMIDQPPSPIKLSTSIIQNLKTAKVIKEHQKEIVGIDFSDDGSLVYTADCNTLNVFVTKTAQNYRKLYMKNHEIEQISHTHNNSAVLVATKKNNLILYWSIHENKIIKMFKGHTDVISNLIICPKDDSFLTTSHDNTMRLWNLNSEHLDCMYKLNVETESMSAYPVANFDPTGVVFGVAWSEQQKDKQVARICLYAVNNCEDGPFADWRKDYNEIKSMKFSFNGDYIAVATSDNCIILLCAFEGLQKHRFTSFLNESSIIEYSFSPDSQFLFSGSENGIVHVWQVDGQNKVKLVTQLKAHIEKVSCVKFSPTQCMLVTGGKKLDLVAAQYVGSQVIQMIIYGGHL